MSTVLDLYFMHYPPASVAEDAVELLRSLDHKGWGKSAPMPAERLHITLHPLGRYPERVPESVLQMATTAGRGLEAESFQVSLDLLQSRSPQDAASTVELVGQGHGVRSLRRFRRNLVDALRRVGFPPAMIRDSFLPHITLDYRHAAVARRRVAPLAWCVQEFCLVVSHFGQGRHEVLARWPMHDRQAPLFG